MIYRVSHIKLDRVNGSKLRFGGQIRKIRKNESFLKNLIRLKEFFFAENARFLEYYVRILALKIGDNII